MHKLIASLLFILGLSAALAQAESVTGTGENQSLNPPVFDSTSTLETYVDYAIRNRSGLRSAYEKWQESLAMQGLAGALDNPLLSYTYAYDKFSEPNDPDRQKLGIMQPFPWFGTLSAKKKAAALNANADYQMYHAEELSTIFAVKSAYYDYYLAARQLALTRESFELMRQFEAVIRNRYQTGLAMHPDLIKAQIELGQMEEMIRSMEQMLAPSQTRLLALLNLPDNISLPLPTDIQLSDRLFVSDSLVALAESMNPNLAAIRNQIESRQAEVAIAKKMTYPELMLGVEYERATLLNDMTAEKETMNEYMVTFQVSLPIWFGKNRAMRSAARARVRMSEYLHQEERNDMAAMISMTNFQYADAVRKLRLYRNGLIPKAKEALNVSFTAYQSGQTDFLMLLDAQRQLLDFELTAERAKVNAVTKVAELEMITGIILVNTETHQ